MTTKQPNPTTDPTVKHDVYVYPINTARTAFVAICTERSAGSPRGRWISHTTDSLTAAKIDAELHASNPGLVRGTQHDAGVSEKTLLDAALTAITPANPTLF